MKKYLFFAIALLGMASCAKDDLGNGNKPNHNGEVEESYIAINLMAADSGTRGTSGTSNDDYEEGTDAERAVKTAHFFFFDEDGEPFTVNNSFNSVNLSTCGETTVSLLVTGTSKFVTTSIGGVYIIDCSCCGIVTFGLNNGSSTIGVVIIGVSGCNISDCGLGFANCGPNICGSFT